MITRRQLLSESAHAVPAAAFLPTFLGPVAELAREQRFGAGRHADGATFVLVHGAWHGGWCWKKVTPLLRGAGHDVSTPTLTGLGERAHLAAPDVGLDVHVQDVVNVLEYEDLQGVILVGHSYGGLVIAGVADRLPERIAHLVYLDAFVPEDGEALVDFIPPAARQGLEAWVRAEGDGWRLPSLRPIPWDVFLREEWEITDEDDVRWMAARLGPQPYKTFTEPMRRTTAAAPPRRTFIRCAHYTNPIIDRFAEAARAPGSGWRYRELATNHDAMVTAPRQLADLLLEAADAGSALRGTDARPTENW